MVCLHHGSLYTPAILSWVILPSGDSWQRLETFSPSKMGKGGYGTASDGQRPEIMLTILQQVGQRPSPVSPQTKNSLAQSIHNAKNEKPGPDPCCHQEILPLQALSPRNPGYSPHRLPRDISTLEGPALSVSPHTPAAALPRPQLEDSEPKLQLRLQDYFLCWPETFTPRLNFCFLPWILLQVWECCCHYIKQLTVMVHVGLTWVRHRPTQGSPQARLYKPSLFCR